MLQPALLSFNLYFVWVILHPFLSHFTWDRWEAMVGGKEIIHLCRLLSSTIPSGPGVLLCQKQASVALGNVVFPRLLMPLGCSVETTSISSEMSEDGLLMQTDCIL